MKKYVTTLYRNADAADSLAKTVYEDVELIDTGVLDIEGNNIKAMKKPTQIAYVRSEEMKK